MSAPNAGFLATWRAALDWRSLAVLRRNTLVYLRNWKTAFLPPAMEPVIFLLAFGLGLRGYVGTLEHQGVAIDYTTYVAPGLIAYTGFSTPYYESLYSAYVRMFYQKTWDGILATQVELPHLVWGEILWAALRGVLNAAIVALVLASFTVAGIVQLRLEMLLWIPPLVAWAGLCFSAFGLVFTALVPAIDHMNYPVFLVGIPLGLVSNTYFPVHSERPWLQAIIEANPIYQLAETARSMLVHGRADHLWMLLLTTSLALAIFAPLAIYLTRRRVLS